MTCARHPAGAHPPAASAPSRSASSPPPPRGRARPDDPRGGRARLCLLLPVAALLLGALGLFSAAPAQAQTTVWSATRTVRISSESDGCSNDSALGSIDYCSNSAVLTDDDFEYKGTTNTINFFGDLANRLYVGIDEQHQDHPFGANADGRQRHDRQDVCRCRRHGRLHLRFVLVKRKSGLERRGYGFAVADLALDLHRHHGADGDRGLDRLLQQRGRHDRARRAAEVRGEHLHEGDLLGGHEAREERRRRRAARALSPHRQHGHAVPHPEQRRLAGER